MQLSHYTAGFVCLWTVMFVAADDYVKFKFTQHDKDIKFTLVKFTQFYNCLCSGTNKKCSVKVRNNEAVLQITPAGKAESDNSNFTHYTCRKMDMGTNFTCTQSAPSYNASEVYHYLQVQNSECGSNKCVAFLIKRPITEIDYSDKKNNTVRKCPNNGICLTPTELTTPVAQESSSVPGTNPTTQSPSPTVKTTRKPTRITPTTVSVGSTSSTKLTTSANMTAAKQNSNSGNDSDNVDVIIGVVVVLVVALAVAAVVIAVYLLRRKRMGQHKHLPDEHEYVNVPKSTATQAGELKSTPNVNPNLSSGYSSCVFDNDAVDPYAVDSVNNLEDSGCSKGAGQTTIENNCVYSKAGLSEETTMHDINAKSGSSSPYVNTLNKPTDVLYSGVSEPGRNPGPELNITSNLNTNVYAKLHEDTSKVVNPYHDFLHSDQAEMNIPRNLDTNVRECEPQNIAQGDESTNNTRDKIGFGLSQNENLNNSSGYSTIEPTYSSQVCRPSPTVKGSQPGRPSPTVKGSQPGRPSPAVKGSQPGRPSPTVKGSQPGRPSPTVKGSQPGNANVYAKLHEVTTTVLNPYNDLLQPEETDAPPSNKATGDVEYCLAKIPQLTKSDLNSAQTAQTDRPKRDAELPTNDVHPTDQYETYSMAKTVHAGSTTPDNSNDVNYTSLNHRPTDPDNSNDVNYTSLNHRPTEPDNSNDVNYTSLNHRPTEPDNYSSGNEGSEDRSIYFELESEDAVVQDALEV